MKKTAFSSAHLPKTESNKAVDMNDQTFFNSKWASLNWMRIDLDDSYFIHEVLILARHNCCPDMPRLYDFQLLVGKLT